MQTTPDEEDNEDEFGSLKGKADDALAELQRFIPMIADARRAYFKSRDESARRVLEEIEQRAARVHTRFSDIVDRMQAAAGITAEQLAALERRSPSGDQISRINRDKLTVDQIKSSGNVDDLLGQSFEKLLAMIGPHALKEYAELPPSRLIGPKSDVPLSLVRGIRPESEQPGIHRFAHAIMVVQDWMAKHVLYDHFAGAMHVPQIAQLADRLEILQAVPGAQKRLKSLWRRPSEEVDSTIFELLVAAGCASMGRAVEFLEPLSTKTPDLLCHDPYPIFIECKRKRRLSVYEIQEEQLMRALFARLDAAARAAGMWGRYEIELSIEAQYAPFDEIVAKLMLQRYAGGRFVAYDWGKVAYVEASARIHMPRATRLYSPNMLQEAFAWNSDLAEFDGLVCRIANSHEPVVDAVERPVALLWSNVSEQAVKKRSWGPMSVMKEALDQIPAGDFGIVYVAYEEGARNAMADRRTHGFANWLKDATHREEIRVPVGRLVRLYPRTLSDGRPDLIESTVKFEADYCDDVLPNLFPSTVFTRQR